MSLNFSCGVLLDAVIKHYVWSSSTKCMTLVLLSCIRIMLPFKNTYQQETMVK